MKRWLTTHGLELAVAAFCGWQAAGLLTAWQHSPFDHLGWLSFLIWLAPLGGAWRERTPCRETALILPMLALGLAVAGRLLELNALNYGALAVALTALLPGAARRSLWLASALAWMPLLGWVARDFPPGAVSMLRLLVAAAGSAACFLTVPKIQTA